MKRKTFREMLYAQNLQRFTQQKYSPPQVDTLVSYP